MHILIEHILTGSTNRPLYESLWNLSISKTVKPNQKAFSENHSVAEICNQIIQEIKRDDPDRSNFYYSTQIAFGCVILYRHQIDKLYNQTRNALQSCTATFFEINWLSQMTKKAPKQEKPKAGGKKKQNEPNKNKKGKQAQPEADDFDMLEDIFKIVESPIAKPKKGKGKGQQEPLQELDPTMAVCAKQITILEAKPTDFVRSHNMQQENAENDFGDDFGGNDKQFDFSFHFSVAPQPNNSENIAPLTSMEYEDFPDELRNAANRELPLTLPSSAARREDEPMSQENDDSQKRKAFVKRHASGKITSNSQLGNYPETLLALPDDSLCEDIMDIVSKQMKSRKRRASVDLSARVEASKGPRLDETDADINNNLDDPIDLPNIGEPLGPLASSTPTKGFAISNAVGQAMNNEETFVVTTPIFPITSVPKMRAKKRKLCIDKVTKLPLDSLAQRTAYYEEHFLLPSPLDSFTTTFFRIKISNEPYLTSPSSGLKHAAEILLSVFKRNLKRIPNALKRKLPENNQPELAAVPAKKLRPSRKSAVKNESLPEHFDSGELPATLDPLEVPSLEELAPVIPEPEILPEIVEFEEQEIVVPKPAKKASKTASFKESEKWSKDKIMKTLSSLWKQKVTSVTMITLCPNANRFVAAGVFFELMELSKLGAVELTQGEDLQLANVEPGSKAKAFK